MATLLAIKIKNFRSFYAEQTLTLETKANRVITALFGPNSGGKSNTAKALATIVNYITNSAAANFRPPYDPFLLRDTSGHEPSCFELRFEHTGHYFSYSFGFTRERIVYEELREKPSKTGKTKIIFSRKADGTLNTSADKFGFGKILKKATRKETLLITKAHESNNEYSNIVFDLLHSLTIISGDAPDRMPLFIEFLKQNKILLNKTVKLLQECDFSIQGLEVGEISVPKEVVATLPFSEDIKKMIDKVSTVQTAHVVRNADQEVVGTRTFDLANQESMGTRKFLEMIVPIIDALDHGKTIYIDEFASYIHPNLANAVIRLFKSKENKKHAKLILNTHNTSIMTETDLSRDEIFIVEKNFSEESIISSLAEKSVRKDEAFEKRYRQGLYGGIPMLQGSSLG